MTMDIKAHQHPDVSIEVDDVDDVYARAVAASAEITYPLTDEDWGLRRFFVGTRTERSSTSPSTRERTQPGSHYVRQDPPPTELLDTDLGQAFTRLDALSKQWRAVDVGASMTFEWPWAEQTLSDGRQLRARNYGLTTSRRVPMARPTASRAA
jgi:hypothetical protein